MSIELRLRGFSPQADNQMIEQIDGRSNALATNRSLQIAEYLPYIRYS